MKGGAKNKLQRQQTPPVHTSNKYTVLESFLTAEPLLLFITEATVGGLELSETVASKTNHDDN